MAVLCAMPRDGRELLLQMGVGVEKKRPVARRSSEGMERCGLKMRMLRCSPAMPVGAKPWGESFGAAWSNAVR